MIVYFKNLIFTDTGNDTSIVIVGTLVNIITGGLFFIIAPRLLGPADFGIFSTVVGTALLVMSFANFGIDSGILRFASKENFEEVLSIAFKSYLSLSIISSIIGLILAPEIAKFLNAPQIANLLRIALVGNIFLLLSNFYIAALQAKRDFLKASIVNGSSNILRILVLFLAMISLKSLGIYTITIIFFFSAFLATITGMVLLPINIVKTPQKSIISFHKFNFWIAMSLIFSSIPLENYFLVKLAGPVAAGIYAAPFKLLTFAYQFGGNFSRVLATRYSSFDTNSKAREFSVKTLPLVVAFCVGLLILIPLSKLIINTFFGPEYLEAVQVFQILSVGFLFFFASLIPSAIIIYYMGASKIAFIITALKYGLFIVLLLILVPKYEAPGAAISFSATEFAAFLFMAYFAIAKLRRND